MKSGHSETLTAVNMERYCSLFSSVKCRAGVLHWVMHLDVQGWVYALGYAFRCAGLGLCIGLCI